MNHEAADLLARAARGCGWDAAAVCGVLGEYLERLPDLVWPNFDRDAFVETSAAWLTQKEPNGYVERLLPVLCDLIPQDYVRDFDGFLAEAVVKHAEGLTVPVRIVLPPETWRELHKWIRSSVVGLRPGTLLWQWSQQVRGPYRPAFYLCLTVRAMPAAPVMLAEVLDDQGRLLASHLPLNFHDFGADPPTFLVELTAGAFRRLVVLPTEF